MRKKTNKGFSLLEILVAMALVALIFTMAVSFNFSSRQQMEDFVGNLTTAIESMTDESTLKNTIARVRIKLSSPLSLDDEEIKEEDLIQKIHYEYSITSDFIAEKKEKINKSDLTQTELESYLKEKNNQDKSFALLRDLQNGEISIEEPIKIIGVGYPQENKFIDTLTTSIYFYPNGDKDSAIIFLASDEEIHYLVIPPFGLNIKHEIITITDLEQVDNEDDYTEKILNLSKEKFEKIRLDFQ